jgi:hypothetical protein
MAESQAAPPSAAAAAEQDVLLATKLYLPRLQPGFVARPRLLDQLGQALGRALLAWRVSLPCRRPTGGAGW